MSPTQAPTMPRPRSGTGRWPVQATVQGDRGAWLPALRLALVTTGVGLVAVEVVVLLLWASAPRSGAGSLAAARLGLTLWAAAHHAAVHLGPATIGITPYLLTALPLVALHRGAYALLADRRLEPMALVPALAVCYGVVTTAVALAARAPAASPSVPAAFVGGAVLAVLAAGTASWRVHGRPERVPVDLVLTARAAARALAALAGAGLLLAVVVLASAHHDVLAAATALRPGVSGAFGLLLLDLLVVPHLTAYGASVLAGPGFGLGAHTSVSLAGVHLGAVPALPVLAALPRSGALPLAALVALAVPVCCGVLAGRSLPSWRHALGAGALAGVGMALVAALVDGSAGPGRLAVTGPSPWRTGLAVAAEVAVGALLAVGLAAWRRHRAGADGR